MANGPRKDWLPVWAEADAVCWVELPMLAIVSAYCFPGRWRRIRRENFAVKSICPAGELMAVGLPEIF